MPLYNLSQINASGIVPLMETTNDTLMFGWLGNLTLITLFIIFYMAFQARTNDTGKSFGFAALLIALFSLMFRTMQLVHDEVVLIAWIIAAASLLISFLTGDK